MSKSYHSNSWDWDYYYLKACPNLGSETQKTQMLAETMATAFRKQNGGRFTCGDKNHLRRDCPKKANKRPPKICPHCRKGMHWAKKIVNLNLILREKLFQETPNRGPPPQAPYKKKQGQILSFPSNPQHLAVLPSIYQPYMIFFLYPQAVPSWVPTGLFGPLPPQTFGLSLGQSSLTSKGITVHPGIIDSNCKGDIQIMMSAQILWQFKRGNKIAQLLLLP